MSQIKQSSCRVSIINNYTKTVSTAKTTIRN